MNKQEIAKAQGKAATGHRQTAALVLDTTTLYYERSSWGQANRYHKSQVTSCKQDRLGIVSNGWLVMVVSDFQWSADLKERTAKAEEFIKNFTGTAADVLDEKGHVRGDVVPAGVNVVLMNNRNILPRKAEPLPASVIIADGVRMERDQENGSPVVVLNVVPVLSHPWLRADNAAKAYAKSLNNGFKLVRLSSQGNTFVYGWQAV